MKNLKTFESFKINEISSELKDRTINKMKSLGHNNRAEKLDKQYNNINYNFDNFINKQLFGKDFIDSIEIKNVRDKKCVYISLSNRQEYNTSHYNILYFIKDDTYHYLPNKNNISRKDVRLLSKIASIVNPNTKYLTGTGDIEINDY